MKLLKTKLPLPPTTNQMYGFRGSKKFLSKESKQWLEEAQWQYKFSYKKDVVLEPVRLIINFYLKRDRDVDNLKLILDSLQGFIIKNDSQVVELHIMKHKDKDKPRVVLVIETLI